MGGEIIDPVYSNMPRRSRPRRTSRKSRSQKRRSRSGSKWLRYKGDNSDPPPPTQPNYRGLNMNACKNAHGRGWTPANHWGMCGQNCPCCRYRVEGPHGFGVCPTCRECDGEPARTATRTRSRRHSRPKRSPAHRKVTMNKKKHATYAAFTAPRDARGRVMVVKNRRTGEWMLPGGLANPGERSSETAVRETREETGLTPHMLREVHNNRRHGVKLYDAPGAVTHSRRGRRALFHKRKDRAETSDYGFVDPNSRRLRVTSYDGTRKNSGSSFRKGTVSHLRALRK